MSERDEAPTPEMLLHELEHLNAYVDGTLARFDEQLAALRRRVDELTQRLAQIEAGQAQTVPWLCLHQCAHMPTVFDRRKPFHINPLSTVHGEHHSAVAPHHYLSKCWVVNKIGKS